MTGKAKPKVRLTHLQGNEWLVLAESLNYRLVVTQNTTNGIWFEVREADTKGR